MNNKSQYVATSGLIAALYVVLTFVSSMVGLSSGVIQIRLSEALNVLVCFTSAAVPGLTIGCFAANLLTGGCALDIVVGSAATLVGAYIGRNISVRSHGKLDVCSPLGTVLANALVVPFVLINGYGINLPYHYLLCTVGIGEIISAWAAGILVYRVCRAVPFLNRMRYDESTKTGSSTKEEDLI